MSSILEIDGLSTVRGTKTVLQDISMRLETGRTIAVLGPNGAGKSSLVMALAGLLPLTAGTVKLDGKPLNGMMPHQIRRAGIAAVPEGHQVLTKLSVHENLEVAAAAIADTEGAIAHAYDIFPELKDLASRAAGGLSGGQQQMLALAQGLIAKPSFLLADEMSLGLAPVIVGRLMKVVERIAEEGIGVLLIEQFTHVALKLADFAYVINRGRIRFAGRTEELRANPDLLHEAYLSGGEVSSSRHEIVEPANS